MKKVNSSLILISLLAFIACGFSLKSPQSVFVPTGVFKSTRKDKIETITIISNRPYFLLIFQGDVIYTNYIFLKNRKASKRNADKNSPMDSFFFANGDGLGMFKGQRGIHGGFELTFPRTNELLFVSRFQYTSQEEIETNLFKQIDEF